MDGLETLTEAGPALQFATNWQGDKVVRRVFGADTWFESWGGGVGGVGRDGLRMRKASSGGGGGSGSGNGNGGRGRAYVVPLASGSEDTGSGLGDGQALLGNSNNHETSAGGWAVAHHTPGGGGDINGGDRGRGGGDGGGGGGGGADSAAGCADKEEEDLPYTVQDAAMGHRLHGTFARPRLISQWRDKDWIQRVFAVGAAVSTVMSVVLGLVDRTCYKEGRLLNVTRVCVFPHTAGCTPRHPSPPHPRLTRV